MAQIKRLDGFPTREGMPIYNFLAGKASDDRGRSIHLVLKASDADWENWHDSIQWVFPLTVRSKHNGNAPVLTDAEIIAIRSDSTAMLNLRAAFYRFLAFLGFHLSFQDEGEDSDELPGPEVIGPAENWEERSETWLTHHNHNYLRITRVLHCLNIFGLHEYAQAFYDELALIADTNMDVISQNTFDFWTDAAFPKGK